MKKFILFALILVLLIIPLGSRAEPKTSELDVLYSIMDDLGGDVREEDLVFNGIILDKFIGQDEMEDLGETIKSQLNLVGIEVDPFIEGDYNEDYYTKEVIFEEDFNQICYIGKDKDENHIAIIINSFTDQEELIGDTYLYINVIKYGDFSEKNDIIEEVKTIYSNYNCKVEITSCLIGEISSNIDYNKMEEEIKKALAKVRANIIEEFSDGNLISYTVHTPYIKEHIKIGKDRTNLNLAIRQSDLDGKIYIWLGTPIITLGY